MVLKCHLSRGKGEWMDSGDDFCSLDVDHIDVDVVSLANGDRLV